MKKLFLSIKNNFKIKYLYDAFILLVIYSLAIVVVSPLIGTLFEFADIKWGYIAVGLTLISAGMLTYFIQKENQFTFKSKTQFFVALGIVVFAIVVYGNYSPVLEMRQDPSLYMFRSLNLVNYGYQYKPMETMTELIEQGVLSDMGGYATIQNGTQYLDGVLYGDFYAGGSFVYALIGFFAKSMIFYGQTFIMVMNGLLLYFICEKLTKNKHSIATGLFTGAFLIAPLIVWFGRGSFCEPTAMTFFLLIFYCLLNEKVKNIYIILIFLGAYTARIDYLILLAVGVFIITHRKIRDGIIFTVLSCIEVFISSKVYWIYYGRITENDMKILRFSIPILIVVLIISIIITKYWKKVEEFYRSKYIICIFAVIFFALLMFMFRNNVISAEDYQIANIHGRDIRTYVEEIFDLLFKVFPPIFIAGGILGIYRFTQKKDIPFLASLFFVGCFTVYAYFFIRAGNSPQLYWMLRRYYNLLIPVAFISFVYLFEDVEKKITIIISIACIMISANLCLDTKQTVEYKGLDESVIEIADSITDNGVDVVFYSSEIRYEISSVLSFSEAEFIPLGRDVDFDKLTDIVKEKKCIYIDKLDFPGIENEEIVISYTKMGETYGEPPKETYIKKYTLYSYDMEEYVKFKEQFNELVFPSWNVTGIYDDNEWLTGDTTFAAKETVNINEGQLVIEFLDYSQYIIENDGFEALDMIVTINDDIELTFEKFEDNLVYYSIPYEMDVESIRIVTKTFRPCDVNLSSDSRDLGLPILMIYFK